MSTIWQKGVDGGVSGRRVRGRQRLGLDGSCEGGLGHPTDDRGGSTAT